jgi:aminomethyltransferase
MKRTPLFATHQKLGGKLVEFGGWEMPVQYTSIMDEHQAVRTAAGIFDISHMGEVMVRGAGAQAFLNSSLTNDIRKLSPGQGQYTLMCNETGGTVDDLYAYHLGIEEYLLIINASRIEADLAWLQSRLTGFAGRDGVTLINTSDRSGAVAIQGPRVCEFIEKCFPGASVAGTAVPRITALKKNEIARIPFEKSDVWVSRTGYTGEDGFEVVADAEIIEKVWAAVSDAGHPFGLKPAGLGARDTLRTEACYPLYGHELDDNTSPIEAGVGFFVAFDKGEFTGRSVLADQKASGPARKLAAFKMTERSAPPRPHYTIWSSGDNSKRAGEVTSGTLSPTLGIGIGLGYVPAGFAAPDTRMEIEIRGKRSACVIVRKPFYRKAN